MLNPAPACREIWGERERAREGGREGGEAESVREQEADSDIEELYLFRIAVSVSSLHAVYICHV